MNRRPGYKWCHDRAGIERSARGTFVTGLAPSGIEQQTLSVTQ